MADNGPAAPKPATMTIPNPNEFSREERNILLLTCPTHFLCHFFILVFPAVTIPMTKSLGIPLEDVLKLSFLMYLSYGLFALPVGLLVDHWQAKGMLVIGLLLMGTGYLLSGLRPDPSTLYLSLGIVGVGASVYHPAGMALISKTVRRRGYALGINGVFGNLGIATAPLVTGLLTWLTSWETAFVILGFTGVGTGIALAFVPVDEAIDPVVSRSDGDGTNLIKYFLILCLALVCGGIAYRGNMILLPAYFELKTTFFHDAIASLSFIKLAGTATLAATILTSLVLMTGMFGQVFGGKLADRIDLRRAYLLVHGASLPFILLMAFTSEYLLALCAGAYVFFSLGMQPVENSLIAAFTPRRWRSTSFAMKFILNFGVGASVIYIVGPIKNAFSVETVYVFLAGVTLVLVLSIVTLLFTSRSIAAVRN